METTVHSTLTPTLIVSDLRPTLWIRLGMACRAHPTDSPLPSHPCGQTLSEAASGSRLGAAALDFVSRYALSGMCLQGIDCGGGRVGLWLCSMRIVHRAFACAYYALPVLCLHGKGGGAFACGRLQLLRLCSLTYPHVSTRALCWGQ
jgi:hypothetical protein